MSAVTDFWPQSAKPLAEDKHKNDEDEDADDGEHMTMADAYLFPIVRRYS